MTGNKGKKDNVISFPADKVSAPKVIELPIVKSRSKGLQRSHWLYGSLAMVFLAALLMNSNDSLQFNSQSRESRSLASVGVTVGLERNEFLEKKIAQSISSPAAQRRPASFGKSPSPADEFKFGFLESKYAVKFYQGKVQEVEFAGTPSQNIEPRYLSNRTQFINKYKNLFSVPFSSTVSLNREVVDQRIHETYALLNAGHAKVGQISFELDVYGRLLGMKIKTIQ